MKRLIVMAIIAALALLASVGLAHDLTPRQAKGPFTLKKLTDDIYVLYGRGGNIGFVVTTDGVVIIDDQFADVAPGIAEQIRTVTDKPFRFLINTHHHGDHVGGNAFFIKMTTIVAHDNVRKHMLAQPQETIASAPGRIAEIEAQIAKLEKDDAQSAALEAARQRLKQTKEALEAARNVKIADIPAPQITINREVRMYLGSKEVQVFHAKRGHTDGDSIVYFPQDKVVHMGDLFFNKVIPVIDPAHGASTAEWMETLDAVCARVDPASQVIPGHGEVTTVTDLKAFKDYFVALRAEVKRAIDGGKTREQATKDVKLSQYESYQGYQQRFSNNIGIVYDELKSGN